MGTKFWNSSRSFGGGDNSIFGRSEEVQTPSSGWKSVDENSPGGGGGGEEVGCGRDAP